MKRIFSILTWLQCLWLLLFFTPLGASIDYDGSALMLFGMALYIVTWCLLLALAVPALRQRLTTALGKGHLLVDVIFIAVISVQLLGLLFAADL